MGNLLEKITVSQNHSTKHIINTSTLLSAFKLCKSFRSYFTKTILVSED